MTERDLQAPGASHELDLLAREAVRVRANAHAPYSQYSVGAALRVASGAIFVGCNVENASFGLTVCAERSAILAMVAAGERDPVAIAIATRGPKPGAPCGMCRQTLAEFALDLPILLLVDDGMGTGARRTVSLAALLPEAFRRDSLD